MESPHGLMGRWRVEGLPPQWAFPVGGKVPVVVRDEEDWLNPEFALEI
jgi:hypothetical protein